MDASPKFDSALQRAYDAWLEEAERDPDRTISLVVHIEDDTTGLEEAGLSVAAALGDQVIGNVRYADLDRLSSHPGVLWIEAGAAPRPKLDSAVRDIRARASTAAKVGAPGDGGGLWHFDETTRTLTATATGAGVVVAIIDSGIDFAHPMFNNAISPSFDSRVIRIWDHSLTPVDGEAPPEEALIASKRRYGVEYTKADIDEQLNDRVFPPLPGGFRHRDCSGHGTYVASAAAGGTTFSAGSDASRIGVAPLADIIAVKFTDTPSVVKDMNGGDVSYDTRFIDAVVYCVRVAQREPPNGKPVVINFSLGRHGVPGDGLDGQSASLDKMFDPSAAAGEFNFPQGAIFVQAAGNEGSSVVPQAAKITIPDAGQVNVPFELRDDRGADRTHVVNCRRETFVPPLAVHCWFRRSAPAADVGFGVRAPTATDFVPDPLAFAGHNSNFFDRNKTWEIRVEQPAARRRLPGGTSVAVERSHAELGIFPNYLVRPPQHALGIYELRIQGPPGTVLFAMCDQHYLGDFRIFGFKVADRYQNGSGLPGPQMIRDAGPMLPIEVTGESTITDGAARNIITVGAYVDPGHAVASFSSRGPLRDFSDLGPLAEKPDISAPGVDVSAALSKDTEEGLVLLLLLGLEALRGKRFVSHAGTSVAAPLVAGVIALMLQKKPDLSVEGVLKVFRTAGNTRPGAFPPPGDPLALTAFGAGMVDAERSHTNTP